MFHAEGPEYCIGKAAFAEFDACPWRLKFSVAGGTQSRAGLRICHSDDFLYKVRLMQKTSQFITVEGRHKSRLDNSKDHCVRHMMYKIPDVPL